MPISNNAPPGNAEPQFGITGITRVARGWYSRGYLPHFDGVGKIQFITFRLADSLPGNVLLRLEEELKNIPQEKYEADRRKRIESHLDAGSGCCALRDPLMAGVVQDTFLKFDREKYHLFAWCIMPNHVHLLIKPFTEVSRIVQSLKSYTGRWALRHNAELGIGVPGKCFWMREYWDRFIRDEKHFHDVIGYIHNNPVKAGLCAVAAEWQWSSSTRRNGNKTINGLSFSWGQENRRIDPPCPLSCLIFYSFKFLCAIFLFQGRLQSFVFWLY